MGAAMVTSPVSYMQLTSFIITNSKIIMHLPHIQLSMCFTMCKCESTSKQTKDMTARKKDMTMRRKNPIKSVSDYSENEGEREYCAMSVLVDMGMFLFA